MKNTNQEEMKSRMEDAVSLEGEEWKPVVGFESYMVSSHGRIKNKNNKLMKTPCGHDGRMRVCFGKNCYNKLVHRIVAEAFIPNTNNYPFVLHMNGNEKDNNVENLMWGNYAINYQHSVLHGTAYRKPIPQHIKDFIFGLVNSGMKVNEIYSKYNITSPSRDLCYRMLKQMRQEMPCG